MEPNGREAMPQWMVPSEDEIRARAYEIYQSRDGGPGNPESDWILAQQELTAAIARVQSTVTAAPATPLPEVVTRDGVRPPVVAQPAQPVVVPSNRPAAKPAASPARRATRGKSNR